MGRASGRRLSMAWGKLRSGGAAEWTRGAPPLPIRRIGRGDRPGEGLNGGRSAYYGGFQAQWAWWPDPAGHRIVVQCQRSFAGYLSSRAAEPYNAGNPDR